MTRSRNASAARAERRSAAWRSAHAALFHDSLTAELNASLIAVVRKKLLYGDDYASIEMDAHAALEERLDQHAHC